MLYMRSFINFFFVPVVAYYMFSMRFKGKVQPDFESFILYVVLVCFNIPVTRVITFILRITTGKNIEADSSYYTVAALIAASILPALYELGKKLTTRVAKQDNEKNSPLI